MKKFGIIIAIETYANETIPSLSKIEFAANDANSIQKIFKDQLYIENDDIALLVNENATKSKVLEASLKIFEKMSSDDELYFYYVGHAYAAKGKNQLTFWETNLQDLFDSSMSMEELIFKKLKERSIQKSFIFIDSSAEELKTKASGIVDNLNDSEYSDLVRVLPKTSIFLSCYVGEKSFPSIQNKHGIWALQLINALNGAEVNAIDKNSMITNQSLANFLANKVPQFITKTLLINERQNPYSIYSTENSIPLMQFESDESEKTSVEIQFNQFTLSKELSIPYKNLKEFNKSKHKIPKDFSKFATTLAQELVRDEYLKIEIEQLFDNARKALRLKNSNTIKDPENGSLHTDYFRYNIYVAQSAIDYTEVSIKRELELRVPLSDFPMPIDQIFTDGFDTITFPIKGNLNSDSIEDALYELEDDNHGTFEHKDNVFSFFPKNIKGIAKIDISKSSLQIKFLSSQVPVVEILNFSQQALVIMATALKNLLS